MPLSVIESRVRHADVALARSGWSDALIRRIEAPGGMVVENGVVQPPPLPRVEFLLCAPGAPTETPYPIALLDVKAEFLPPDHGVDEPTLRAACLRLHVPIAIATNGHQFTLFDLAAGYDRKPRTMHDLPSPGALRARFEELRSLRLVGDTARPLMVPDPLGMGVVRPHEDAAMRAILEAVVRGSRRVLVKVTAGAANEGAAVLAARRLAAAGAMRTTVVLTTNARRTSAVRAVTHTVPGLVVLQAVPGAELPPGTDAVLLDECHHAAAWPELQRLLAQAPDALHIGVSGAPLAPPGETDPTDATRSLALLAHFGEPVYAYTLGEASHDGWCGALEIVRRDLDGAPGSADDLFRQLLAVDGPLQRALIVCPDTASAESMATELSARHARWAERMQLPPTAQPYAKATDDLDSALAICTTQLSEDAPLADIRILALLTPERRASVLLRAISRAAATSPADGKILLRVLDYVGATRVVPEVLRDRFRPVSAATISAPGADAIRRVDVPGGTLSISPAGRACVRADGRVEDTALLGRELAAVLVRKLPTLEALRAAWSRSTDRAAVLRLLPEEGRALARWKLLADQHDADDYDAMAELGWGVRPRSRADRAAAFGPLHEPWLASLPQEASAVLRVLAKGFIERGIAAFDDLECLQLPEVERVGGMRALRKGGAPADLVRAVGDRLLRT